MKKLITQLRIEHEELMNKFNNLSGLQIENADSIQILMQIKEQLMEHIAKEDIEFYAHLSGNEIPSESIKEYFQSYSREMAGISQIIANFFDKIERNKMTQPEYRGEIERIIFLLKARISWEESMFFIFDREVNDK